MRNGNHNVCVNCEPEDIKIEQFINKKPLQRASGLVENSSIYLNFQNIF